MGLDLIEVIMQVEDEFQITIVDDDFGELKTVGDLHDYIVRRQTEPEAVAAEVPPAAQFCLSSAVFLQFRQALLALLPLDRRTVHPRMELAALIPAGVRQDVWRQLHAELDLLLPPLYRPFWMHAAIAASSATSAVNVAVQLRAPLPLAGTVAALDAWNLYRRTQTFANRLRDGVLTVRDLIASILELNYRTLHKRFGLWGHGREHVWERLQAIVSEQLGVPLSEIKPETRWMEDLAAD